MTSTIENRPVGSAEIIVGIEKVKMTTGLAEKIALKIITKYHNLLINTTIEKFPDRNFEPSVPQGALLTISDLENSLQHLTLKRLAYFIENGHCRVNKNKDVYTLVNWEFKSDLPDSGHTQHFNPMKNPEDYLIAKILLPDSSNSEGKQLIPINVTVQM